MSEDFTHAAHHPFGPSSLEQKLNCLASYHATKDEPNESSTFALEGTAAHELAERCRDEDVPASKYLGTEIRVQKDGEDVVFPVTQEMADAVQIYIDHINSFEGIDFNEQKVYYPRWVPDPKPGGFGTLDAARVRAGMSREFPPRVMLADFKYGKGKQVFAEGNEQLLGCALGFYETWDHVFDFTLDTVFDLWIIQPRLDWKDRWQVTLNDVLKWATNVLEPRAKLAYAGGQPFTPGKWCQFCKIKATCKARAASAFEQVVEDFDDIDDAVKKVDTPRQVVGKLTNDEIAKLLPKLGQIKAWCKDIEAYAFGEKMRGNAIGDYKFVHGRADRAWAPNAEGLLLEAATATATSPAEFELAAESLFEPRKLKSPAQIEKILPKKLFAPATDKKPAGELADLIVKPKGKLKLVPGDDKRPEAVVDATADFEDLEGDDE
jgi:hypothetical protein